MIKIAVIPSRYASTRLNAKPLVMIGDKCLIQRVYEAVKQTELFDQVIVATDHQAIYDEVKRFGGEVVMTSEHHQSGSDRIAEVCLQIDCDIVVNVQGDEPFVTREPLEALLNVFIDSQVEVASLMHHLVDKEEIANPNNVKVIVNQKSDAIYFSRSVIPYQRNQVEGLKYYKHIGVYAYKKETLMKFVQMPQSLLEKTESLEQLRLIDNGISVRMVESQYQAIGIDTPEDLEKAREYVKTNSL